MTHIDQFHQRIQIVDPNTGQMTPFFFRVLNGMYERLGGSDDVILEIENGELYETGMSDSRLIEVSSQLNELELLVETKDSQIRELEKRIEDLEKELDLIIQPKDSNSKEYALVIK